MVVERPSGKFQPDSAGSGHETDLKMFQDIQDALLNIREPRVIQKLRGRLRHAGIPIPRHLDVNLRHIPEQEEQQEQHQPAGQQGQQGQQGQPQPEPGRMASRSPAGSTIVVATPRPAPFGQQQQQPRPQQARGQRSPGWRPPRAKNSPRRRLNPSQRRNLSQFELDPETPGDDEGAGASQKRAKRGQNTAATARSGPTKGRGSRGCGRGSRGGRGGGRAGASTATR